MAVSKRFGVASNLEIDTIIKGSIPHNTDRNRNSVWNQFQQFCAERGHLILNDTPVQVIAAVLKDWAVNMRKSNGEEYTERSVKTMWNVTANIIQEKYFHEYNRKFNPFTDIEFKEARDAKNAKRRRLKIMPPKVKQPPPPQAPKPPVNYVPTVLRKIAPAVKVVSGFYTATPTLVHSAAPNVQLRNSDVALIKKNISRAKSIERARALKSAQAQENSGGEYDFSKKARTSIGSAETFIPKPGPSTMISGSDESSSLDVYDRTEKILGFSEPESQAETLTEGEFMEEKFMMTVKEEPIELPAEEAQAFPLEIQLSTSSAPVVPELVDKKPITPTIESWPISNQGTESSTLALPPQAVGSIPATSNLASPLHSKPAPARRKKPCTITAEPTEESLTMSLSQFPSKTLPVQDSSAKEVELDETAQEAPVREPSIVYFGGESSKDDSDVCRLSAEDRSNVEAVLRRLRMEKLLLEIDKLKLEQKKLTAEKTNILLKKSIFSLRKTLMSEDDDSLVQKTVPVVTPPVARVRDEVPVTTSLPTLGSGVSLHSVHEQVAPQTGIERETENGRKLPPKQTKAIQSATPRSKENESQRISREPTQKSAQNQQIAKDPLATGGDRIKIAESRKVVSPSSEDVQNSRVIGETVKVSSSSSSQRKTTGPKSALHPGETKTTLVQPNQNLGTSSASDDICRVGLVATNQKSSEHSEIPCATPSYECGGSMPIADGDQGQTEDYIVRSMCDIVEKGGPADVKRERNIGLTEIHGTESGADSRLSSGLESEGPKAGTSWLENAQARISKRFQQISDPEASLSKRMRMDDDDSVP